MSHCGQEVRVLRSEPSLVESPNGMALLWNSSGRNPVRVRLSSLPPNMLITICILQLLTLFSVLYLASVILKITNVVGLLNSESLASLMRSGKRIEAAAAAVAQDLSDAHARADAVEPGQHGEAADAASQQTESEKLKNNNPKIKS